MTVDKLNLSKAESNAIRLTQALCEDVETKVMDPDTKEIAHRTAANLKEMFGEHLKPERKKESPGS